MRHKEKFTIREKVNIWLDLCDFTFTLMRKNLSAVNLNKKLNNIRNRHMEDNYVLLSKLAKLK